MSNFNKLPRLDSVNIDLNGVNLIEASAGTGKTYNIQNLAARLIVEKALPINGIVIVTFTDKAARELTDRLRTILLLLCEALEGKLSAGSSQQKRVEELLERFDRLAIPRDVQLSRLKAALQNFDDNMVSTIHGFCGRILSENAFAGSVAFHVRLEKNISGYVDKLLGDFCRIYRLGDDKLPCVDNLMPRELLDFINTMLRHHKLELNNLRPAYADTAGLRAKIADLQKRLCKCGSYTVPLGSMRGCLNKIGSYSGEEYLDLCLKTLDELHSDPACTAEMCYRAGKLLHPDNFLDRGKAAGKHNLRINELIKSEEIFLLAQEFCQIIDIDCKVFLQQKAWEFVHTNLELCKEQENFQSFDDLLLKVYDAVQQMPFRKLMQKKYHIGIIDEFQDTDAVQYGIFKAVFVEREHPAFFMVGDPKQAIYSFRGGDLAAYMTARNECQAVGGKIFTLDINYRSSARLINEFNRFFEHDHTFASDEIFFNKAFTPENDPPGIAFENEEIAHPLLLDHQPAASSEELQKKCAREIALMLKDGRYSIPDNGAMRPLTPGDIAVLAYDGYVLDNIRRELEKYNIPVIGERKSGIWSSPEAAVLLQVMRSVLDNGSGTLLREMLLSEIGGMSLADLDAALVENKEKLLLRRLDIMALAQCWHENGTAAFMRLLFEKFDLKKRLIVQLGGERKLTNYTQLGDLLSAAEQRMSLPPRGVLNFLQEKCLRSEYDDESMEMLESDRAAVKLMTIHSSKGLQFPVVFLPQLAARSPLTRDDLKVYHRQNKIFCNPDKLDKTGTLAAGIEELQEIMRLVYVAVTRSCCFCRISWGKVSCNKKAIERTPMHWLFAMQHGAGQSLEDDLAGFLGLRSDFELPEITLPENMTAAEPFGSDLPGIYTSPVDDIKLVPPEPVTPVADSWKIMSYSSLPVHSAANNMVRNWDEEAFDHDSSDELAGENEDGFSGETQYMQGGIWAVPRGAGVGNAWHMILEKCDFTEGIELSDVERVMKLYGFNDPVHHQAAHEMFKRLLQYKLPCGAALKDIPRERTLKEFEFMLNSPQGFEFSALCCAVREYMLSEFNAAPAGDEFFRMDGGFFTGFIDLVFEYKGKFYIADWKSNDLAGKASAFYGKELKMEMYSKHYPLQYLCYLAALVRFLEHQLKKPFDQALYDRYIGGVYYIFLRGMCLENAGGVFSARVPYQTVRDLLDILTAGSGEVTR